MTPKIVALLVAGLFSLHCAAADPVAKTIWITVGDAAYTQLQKVAPHVLAKESSLTHTEALSRTGAKERVHLVEVNEQEMLNLSAAIHSDLHRCGGFLAHASEAAAKQALAQPFAPALLAAVRPSYAITQQAVVTPMLAQMQDSNIAQTIIDMSAFANRYYRTNNGVSASNWLSQRWTTLAAGRSDIAVSQYTHSAFAQKSVILTITGSTKPSEVIVLGAHLDSINQAGTSESTRAPGADDDASGVASLTEALRVMVANGYKPRRTIKFIGYAAEEAGLLGSQDIARNHKTNNVNVVGVMQLDMTNYKGSPSDIYMYTDYTDSQQNDYVVRLITTYLPTLKIGYDRCGYGCSDHASWTGQGYWSSMPFETAFTQDNPYIHTANDTYANSGGQAIHALKFARMALAYAVELGSEAGGVPVPEDRVETFSGSLAKNQTRSFGPYKVGAGGGFKAVLTGSGDTDLYVRKAGAPTTTTFDCKSDGPTSAETCTLAYTAAGDAYVLLNGYTASSYTLTLTYRPQ